MKRLLLKGFWPLSTFLVMVVSLAGCQNGEVPVETDIPVTEVQLDKTALVLLVGENQTLVATVLPVNATDKTVTWSSSDEDVAMVSSSGKVLAVKIGSATITAKAGDASSTCSVTVTESKVEVTSITLNKNSLALKAGESETLVATVLPVNATDKTVSWTSSNPSVATVNNAGKVTAVLNGSATITARAGNASAICTVTVSETIIEVTSVTLNKSSLTLRVSESETLVATVLPGNATDKTVTWTSSDSSIATVDNSGKVMAVLKGTATITAKSGNVSATCSVTVTSADIGGGGIEDTGEEDMN